MINQIEDEVENVDLNNFDVDLDENIDEIDRNVDNTIKNPDENLNKKISNIIIEIDKNEYSDELVSKIIKAYHEIGFNSQNNGIDYLKKILLEASKFTKLNFNKRISEFFDFISGLKMDFQNIIKILDLTNENLDKDNNKDILLFWKEIITEEYLKENKIQLITNKAKDIVKLLLENNYNIFQIYNIFSVFKIVINSEHLSQYEIIKSIINVIISYPNVDLKDLRDFVKKYYIKNDLEIDEKGNKMPSLFLDRNVVLEYYLKVSSDKLNESSSSELSIEEIFQQLKIKNPSVSDLVIQEKKEQLQIIQSTINNPIYQNYDKFKFKEWTKTELPKLINNNNNLNRNIAIILGMISLVVKQTRGYYLRNTQLIAVLMFIGKDKKYGLVEEISTGEGKSCIISSLSIYFALMGYKVDVISSSYTLAQRDSDEFRNIYDYFNLTTGFPFNSESSPYNCDILYGTFFEFEGDYLRELTSNRKIRNKRPYEVIIIDEVDNLFIDNILGSTRLTNPSRGFKFLIPLYLSSYLSFELFDFFFLLFFKLSLENIKDKEKRKKFENIIKNPEERKKEIINMMKKMFEIIFNSNKEGNEIEYKLSEEEQKKFEEEQKKFEQGLIQTQNALIKNRQTNDFFSNFAEYLEYPQFLVNFVKTQSPYWINSAYDAKNNMIEDKDYVISKGKGKGKDIAPVDRTNTGEIELSMVYSEGLHQMLQIKHLLRIKDESLVHTFLSHITFFQKYKNDNNFLFFGLTGTIGDPETQKIYKNKYFNSKILFIPQYKKKRFVELPPILCNIKDHYNIICEDIITNFLKGRKILVICSSIKEANVLKKILKSYKIENSELSYLKDDDIILYTRSDTDEKDNIIKQKNKRIFLSTNFGGRGTDLQTNENEERNGGLHVILTDMPSNYRVLKQAFGRTSREGKKGTGQMILKNTIGYNSYSELMDDMNQTESKRIKKIESKLKLILFKDRLFEEFCKCINGINYNSYLPDDINERWAYFLDENLTYSTSENFNEKEILDNFKKFVEKITKILCKKNEYEKFTNPFFKMQEGLRLHGDYSLELLDYLRIDDDKKRFYFGQPYISCIVDIINAKSYNKEFFDIILDKLKDSKERIKLLIEKSIKPFLNSFEQWGELIKNFNIGISKSEEFFQDIEKPLIYQDYENSELYKQYNNINNILTKISERINENISSIENYKKILLKDKYSKLFVIEETLEEGLDLDENESQELDFFSDATFNYVYSISLHRKLEFLESIFWNFNKLGIYLYIIGFCINPIIGGIIGLGVTIGNIIIMKRGYDKYKDVEITENTIFAKILKLVIRTFSGKQSNKETHLRFIEHNYAQNKDLNVIKVSNKLSLFNKIFENIENRFKVIEELDIIKFLIFVDSYLSEGIWQKNIKRIFIKNFKKIYENKICEKKDELKIKITEKNFQEHIKQYDEIFEEFLNECCKDIKKLGTKKKYDEKTGINCLEHLFIYLNPEKLTDEIANETVKQMLKYHLITEDGIINENLFEDCFINKDTDEKIKLKQLFNINIITRLKDKEEVIEINKLSKFKITGFEIPMVDPFFYDLKNFYTKQKYNVKEQLEKDYCLYIINNFKNIIQKMLLINQKTFDLFYKSTLNLVKNLIQNLLEEKIFIKYNQKSIESEISDNLTGEEKLEFKKMIESAGESAFKAINN